MKRILILAALCLSLGACVNGKVLVSMDNDGCCYHGTQSGQ